MLGSNVAFSPQTNNYVYRDPVRVSSHGSHAVDMTSREQPPTQVEHRDNLLLLVGLPPPPPPTMPPPRKSKRAQSTPRTFQHHRVADVSSRADNIVEERMRAARRIYQSDDLLLVHTLGGSASMDPISESRSMISESRGMASPTGSQHHSLYQLSPVERNLRNQRSMEPVEESDWARSSHEPSPRHNTMQIVAVGDDDFVIPVPPPLNMISTHMVLQSSANNENKSPFYTVENPEVPRLRPFSPNFRSGESLLAGSPSALRHSPSKSVHSPLTTNLPSKSPAHSIGSIISYDNISRYRSKTFEDTIVDAKSSSSSTRSLSPQSRHNRKATSKQQPPSRTPERVPQRTRNKRSNTPDKTRTNEGLKQAVVTHTKVGPLNRLRPKTPERLRLRQKTTERKSALDRQTITAESSASASITPSNSNKQQPKQGFFRKFFSKKKKSNEVVLSTVAAAAAAESADGSLPARLPRLTGSSGETQPPSQPLLTSQMSGNSTIQRHHPIVEVGSNRGSSSHGFDHSQMNVGISSSLSGSLVTGRIPNVEEDRPGLFAANDDISTLTIPTLEAPSFGFGGHTSFESSYRRKDPSVHSGATSDPMGRYWAANSGSSADKDALPTNEGQNPTPTIDPFREPFFAEPDGASPAVHNRIVANSNKALPELKVNVSSIVYDPAGDSPLQSSRRPPVVNNGNRIQDPSPRGYQTPIFLEHPTQDPVGESPLHKNDRGPSALVDGSPFAADPPLYLESMDEAGLISEGSSITSGDKVERKADADKASSNPSPRIPRSPLQYHGKGRAHVPRSPLQQAESDGSLKLRKDTIASYSPRVLPPTDIPPPLDNTEPVLSDVFDSVQVPTPKTRNTTQTSSPGIVDENNAKDEQPKSPQKSPRIMRKAQECSPRRTWVQRTQRGVASPSESSPEFHAAEEEQEKPKVHEEQANRTDDLDRIVMEVGIKPISPLASVESSAASLTSAAKKASKRLTMSNAAKVNARAVAYLHSLNHTTTPRAFWKETDSEAGSSVGSPSVMVGSLSSAILFGSPTGDKNQGVWETHNSRLFSTYSKGKFKNRKSHGSSTLSVMHVRNEDVSSVSEVNTHRAPIVSSASGAHEIPRTTHEVSHRISTVQSLDVTSSSCPSKNVTRHLSHSKTMTENKMKQKGASRSSWFGLSSTSITDQDLKERWTQNDVTDREQVADVTSKSYMVDVNDCFSDRKGLNKASSGELVSMRTENAPTVDKNWAKHVAIPKTVKDIIDLPLASVDRSLPSSSRRRTNFAVAKGFEMLREQREHDITLGKADRVSPAKRIQPPIAERFHRTPDVEPKDPIQRAGRRLLAKAAVPIQAAARRYLAQQQAVDRMWALLEIQSYIRRWRAEAVLVASIISAVTIQAIVRGYIVRRRRRLQIASATIIQKVVRGYMISAKTYDFIYKVVVAQAQARGWITRLRFHRHLAKVRAATEHTSACRVQTWWRSHSSQMLYQFLLFDTITAQSAVRRYLARRLVTAMRTIKAVNAAKTIQTAWRGFKDYSDFIFLLVDCMLIQRTVRSWFAKKETKKRREFRASVRIQSIWRCYALNSRFREYCAARTIQTSWRCYVCNSRYKAYCAARTIQTKWRCYSSYSVYNDFRAATSIQSEWRRYVARLKYQRSHGARIIQTQWRCYSDCSKYRRNLAATTIQKEWRCFTAFANYIFNLADIIRIQQAVRIWIYRRELSALRIQTCWRAHHALSQYSDYKAAERIQKHWRRAFAVSEYEQNRRYITTIQSVARYFMARNEVQTLRSQNAAVMIQKHWRRTAAQNDAMYDLACILLVQSVARQKSAVREVCRLHVTDVAVKKAVAATKIQATWRSFWEFSHYLILQYETVRMQALIRGKLFRQDFNLQLGCCIMIQSAIRRFLALGKRQRQKLADVLTVGRAWDSRERLSSSRIQFWWRIVLECRKEKSAALVIERFFLTIKREIEREIERSERKLLRRAKREDDDTLLEKAWLKTVDSNTDVFSFASESGSDVFDFSPKAEVISSPTKSRIQPTPRAGKPAVLSPKAMQSSPLGGHSSYLMSPNTRPSLGVTSPGARPRILSPSSLSGMHPHTHGGINIASPAAHSAVRTPSSRDHRLLSPSAQLSVVGNTGLASPTATPTRSDSSHQAKKNPPPPSASPHKSPQKRSGGRHINHHASSPPKHLIMRHEYELSPMTKQHPKSTRASEDKLKSPHRHSKGRQPEDLTENLSLEEAFLDAEIRQEKDRKYAEESYKRKQQPAHNHLSLASVQHFFADDLESFDDSCNMLNDTNGLFSVFQRSESAISASGPASSRSDADHGRSDRRSSHSSSRSRSKQEGSSRSKPSSRSSQNGGTPTTQSSPSRRSSPSMSKPSPRHNKIHVMKAYPDYPKKATRTNIENVEDDEYGMI